MNTDLPKAPATNDQKYLAALVAGVAELTTLLRQHLDRAGQPPAQDTAEEGDSMQRRLVSEPAPPAGPRMAQPVTEPDRGRGGRSPAASPPERPGLNAPRAAWQTYADALGVTARAGAGRAELIAAVDAADPQPAKRVRKKAPKR